MGDSKIGGVDTTELEIRKLSEKIDRLNQSIQRLNGATSRLSWIMIVLTFCILVLTIEMAFPGIFPQLFGYLELK